MPNRKLTIALFTLLSAFYYSFSFAQSHRYIFANALDELGATGPNLTEVLSCGATNGAFNTEVITTTAGICSNSTVFSFHEGGGLAYPNNPAFINDTYTIHMFFKFNAFSGYQRIIDFKNSTTDRGIYTLSDCLNFYPNGNIGTCPFFVAGNYYYLITLVRNGVTKAVTIYVNGMLFSTYTDAADDYVPTTTTTPILFFRDDNAFACEDRGGSIKYLELKPSTSTAPQVLNTWNSICAVALPIQLINFSAAINNQHVQLQWHADNEFNNDRFEIEKSIDGINYSKVATLKSVGGSAVNVYNLTDADPLFAVQYYRLKIIDKAGSFTYSKVVPVSNKQTDVLAAFPNPARKSIAVFSPKKTDAVITNSIGVVIRKIQLLKGNQPVDISLLATGIYFLKTEDDVIKLIKQ